nr:uncharacterized protein LOC117853243 [Setaria viridis]
MAAAIRAKRARLGEHQRALELTQPAMAGSKLQVAKDGEASFAHRRSLQHASSPDRCLWSQAARGGAAVGGRPAARRPREQRLEEQEKKGTNREKKGGRKGESSVAQSKEAHEVREADGNQESWKRRVREADGNQESWRRRDSKKNRESQKQRGQRATTTMSSILYMTCT